MSESDWDHVTILRKSQTQIKKDLKGQNPILGKTETTAKYNTGNKQTQTDLNKRKLDENNEGGKVETVPLSLGQTISKGRLAKKLTQKQLAQRINVKPDVINQYESGKGIPNSQILGKIEKIIGVKLRGKNIGTPL